MSRNMAPKVSRFFQGGSDSDSGSDHDLYSESEEEKDSDNLSSEEEDSEEDSEFPDDSDSESDSSSDDDKVGSARFLKTEEQHVADEELDDGDTKPVRSAKDKRFEEAENIVKIIENAVKISDWVNAHNEFDKLTRVKDGLIKLLDGKNPKLFIKTISELETTANEVFDSQKVAQKKLSISNQRGLVSIRQKTRRLVKEEAFAKDVESYRENPEEFMKEVVVEKPTEKKPKPAKPDYDQEIPLDDQAGYVSVGPNGKALNYTTESILKNLRAFNENRGRKGNDRAITINGIERLLKLDTDDYRRIRVLLALLAARFDTTSTTGNPLEIPHWKAAQDELQQLYDILENNKSFIVTEVAEDWEDDDKIPQAPDGGVLKIPGSTASYMERLDDELTKSLQGIDPHTPEYVERLCDETLIYQTILRTQLYQERLVSELKIESELTGLSRVLMRRAEHIYFKPCQVVKILESTTWAAVPESINESTITPRDAPRDPDELMKAICNHIFKIGDDIQKPKAMLFQIYWLALQGDYYKARDLALMSHLTENISNYDTSTQILFDRALVQIGMAAFRKGLIADCQHTLQEIVNPNRQKELLAQGVQMQRYNNQVTPEQERLEKQRQYPFHMHINLELLEAIYLTSSMLLEMPLLAQLGSAPESRKRVISKQFRRSLEYLERLVFTGPPENTRDHVIQAAKALAAGDWKNSAELINAIKIWDLLPNAEKIKAMLNTEIQEQGLRTYLFTYAPFYDTLSLDTLCLMFDLEHSKISNIICKMIHEEELAAALDKVSNSIIFRSGVDLSRLHTLALALADKASILLEANEKTLEDRTRNTTDPFVRQTGNQGGRGNRGGLRQGRGGGGARDGGQRHNKNNEGRQNQGNNGAGSSGGTGGSNIRPRNQGFQGGALGRTVQT